MINTVIAKDYKSISEKATAEVIEYLHKVPDALISFPGGDTPLGMIQEFVTCVNEKKVDISKAKFVSLDEWVGLSKEDHGSCGHFLQTHLFSQLAYQFQDMFLLNGAAADMEAEVKKHLDFFAAYGPLDLSVLGIGMNGHLGFNEEGSDFDRHTHITPLSPITQGVMAKYFDQERTLTHGITQGLGQIMSAEKILVLANGSSKAAIVKQAIYGPVTPQVPASILQTHGDCTFLLDELAADMIR